MEIKRRRSILQFRNCLIILLGLSCITVSLQAQDEHDSPDKDHSQKAVLVTGASTGIGRNIAQRLASEGHFVYAGSRKEKDLLELNAIENIEAISVKMDPRIRATDKEILFWSYRLNEVSALLDNTLSSLDAVRQAQRQIEALLTEHPGDRDLQQTGATALERITAWDGKIIQVLHQTYEDEDAWETMLAGQLRFLLDVIDTTGAPVTAGALLRLADLKSQWSERQTELPAIKTGYINVINDWARRQNVPHVASPGQ